MGAGGSCCHGVPDDGANVTKMDLSHCGLEEVPPVVFQSERYVETLNLSQNRILSLPPQLFHCQELKHLKLIDNGLDSIPPAIGSLPHLVSLRLDKNCIRDLPENIKMCRKLKRLSLSNNQLQQLPNILTQLIGLEELYLNDCDLTFLPASVGRLTKLRVLELRNNRLSNLPLSMNRMTCLSRLDLGDNSIEILPECMSSFCSLQELLLDNNDLETFSGSGLRKLEHLDVSYNNLRTLGKDIGQCVGLGVLNLGWNYLETLPETMSSLTFLEMLVLEMNELTTLPRCLGKMSRLEEINVANNRLCDLPSSIGLLRQLIVINLSRNYVQELPCEIGSCQRLSIINASYNRLQALPGELGYLNNLKVLDLVGNFLMYLPISMSNLKDIRAIWLSANQNVPLIPFTEDVSMASGERFLTNIALPQLGESAQPPADPEPQPVVEKSWRRKIRFEEDDDVQPGRLDRTPTPFPKELRQPARKPALRTDDNYVNVVDGRVAVFQQPQQQSTQTYSDDNVIREANIRKNGQPRVENSEEHGPTIYTEEPPRERKKSVKFSDEEEERSGEEERGFPEVERTEGRVQEREITTISEEDDGKECEDEPEICRLSDDQNQEEENEKNERAAAERQQRDSEAKAAVIYSNLGLNRNDGQVGYYAPIKLNAHKVDKNVPYEASPSPDLPPYPVDDPADDVFDGEPPRALQGVENPASEARRGSSASMNNGSTPSSMKMNGVSSVEPVPAQNEAKSSPVTQVESPYDTRSQVSANFIRQGLPASANRTNNDSPAHFYPNVSQNSAIATESPYGSRPTDSSQRPAAPSESPYGTRPTHGVPSEPLPQNSGLATLPESPYGRPPNDIPSDRRLPQGIPNDSPYGKRPPNESPYGGRPQNEPSYAPRPANESPYGSRPPSESLYGSRPQTESPYVSRPPSESPYGSRPQTESPYVSRPPSESPYGSRPPTESPYVSRPPSESPYGSRPPSESPYGSRPPTESSYAPRPLLRESPYGSTRAPFPDVAAGVRESPYGQARPDVLIRPPFNHPMNRQSPYGTIRQMDNGAYGRTTSNGTIQPSFANRQEFSQGMSLSFDGHPVSQYQPNQSFDGHMNLSQTLDRPRIRQSHSVDSESMNPAEMRVDYRVLNQSSNSLEGSEFQRQGSFTRGYEQGLMRQSPHLYENSRGPRPVFENGNRPAYGMVRPGFRPTYDRQSPYGTIRQSPVENNNISRPPSENGNDVERPPSKQEMLSIAERNKSQNIAPPCYEIAKMYSTKAALFEKDPN